MLNTVAGLVGIGVQAAVFMIVYLWLSPGRGRGLALLFAALLAVDGYGLLLLGAMLVGIPWQTMNILLAAAAIGVLLLPSVRPRLTRSTGALVPLLRSQWRVAAIVGVTLSIQLVAAALAPEMSIDGQLYHGPTLAQLAQHGTVWGWDVPNQYIYYTDLTMVTGLNLATFTGATVLDNGVQIPHLLILVLAIVAALRARFPVAWVRFAFAALLIAAPVVWIQPRILYVDVAYAAALVAVVVLIVTVRAPRGVDLVVAAVAGASIFAIKPAGLLTGIFLLCVLAVVFAWRMRREGMALGAAIGRIVAVGLPAAVLAGGFYLRNYVLFANPVYPVTASFGPISLPGIIGIDAFASGDRGSGLIDPLRWATYASSVGSGMVNGVMKLDYDPRTGGFGYIPTALVVLALALVIAQVIRVVRSPGSGRTFALLGWRGQLAYIAIPAVILLIQPSTFDTRYVIGPTVLLSIALLLTRFRVAEGARTVAVVAIAAIAVSTVQIAWTEKNVYPGLNSIRQLRAFPEVWQPMTPGSVWGRSENVAWLPDDDGCYRIALQTFGGVASGGMKEQAILSTLPYGLYGDHLCNRVEPMQLEQYRSTGSPLTRDPIESADYLVLFEQDVEAWRRLFPDSESCWSEVQRIPGSESSPLVAEVLVNSCSR